jgi:1,4-alpha-glucan branching enzyme
VAAHAFLPLYAVEPGDARGHVRAAARAHRAAFGRHPPGVWLPECGYVPGLDRLLADEGLLYFFVDAHGALLADPPAALGVHAPLVCPSGVLAFPRDPDASRAVWSAESGYPGDPRYREFYRDQGFELPEAELQGLLLPTGERRGLGLKYHRITGRDVPLGEKAPYAPAEAEAAVRAHAAHFVAARQAQASAFAARHHRPAVLTAPFDAELFGHWWFEGPAFLDQVVRGAAATSSLAVSSPGQVIRGAGPFQLATPAASSWGRAGYGEVWLNEANDWVWPPLHRAARRTRALAQRHRGAQGVLQRALKQLARELLLASASDWPFMMSMGTTVSYAEARVRAHLARHEALADQLEAGQVDEAALAAVEAQDNLLPDIDFEDFA